MITGLVEFLILGKENLIKHTKTNFTYYECMVAFSTATLRRKEDKNKIR